MAVNYVDPRSIHPVTERLTGEALEAIKDAVEGINNDVDGIKDDVEGIIGLPDLPETGKHMLVVEDGVLAWEEVVE